MSMLSQTDNAIPKWFETPEKGEYVGVSLPFDDEILAQKSAEFSAILSFLVSQRKTEKQNKDILDTIGSVVHKSGEKRKYLFTMPNESYDTTALLINKQLSFKESVVNISDEAIVYDDGCNASGYELIFKGSYKRVKIKKNKSDEIWVSIVVNTKSDTFLGKGKGFSQKLFSAIKQIDKTEYSLILKIDNSWIDYSIVQKDDSVLFKSTISVKVDGIERIGKLEKNTPKS